MAKNVFLLTRKGVLLKPVIAVGSGAFVLFKELLKTS